mmetsp:Transcript_121271/g.343184  ORF Transcript_121271/g.343184 Transcript_121271/m.343184 type:complete len:225 (+) Transcript_121271:352-1026(+)
MLVARCRAQHGRVREGSRQPRHRGRCLHVFAGACWALRRGVLQGQFLLIDDAGHFVLEGVLVNHLCEIDHQQPCNVPGPDDAHLLPVQGVLEGINGEQCAHQVPDEHGGEHQLDGRAAAEEESRSPRDENKQLRGNGHLQPNRVLRMGGARVTEIGVVLQAFHQPEVHAEVIRDGHNTLHDPQHHGEADEARDVRVLRRRRCGLSVLRDGDHGDVVEQRQQYDV